MDIDQRPDDGIQVRELLQEIAEDHVSFGASLNRILEGQTQGRTDIVRELDRLREEIGAGIMYRALKDLCRELAMPLAALEAMVRDDRITDPVVLRDHVGALVTTLESVLGRMGAEKIAVSEGEEIFSPERHFCVRLVTPAESPFPSAPPRTVVRVLEHGYTLAGKLLAPARVEVQSEAKG